MHVAPLSLAKEHQRHGIALAVQGDQEGHRREKIQILLNRFGGGGAIMIKLWLLERGPTDRRLVD